MNFSLIIYYLNFNSSDYSGKFVISDLLKKFAQLVYAAVAKKQVNILCNFLFHRTIRLTSFDSASFLLLYFFTLAL